MSPDDEGHEPGPLDTSPSFARFTSGNGTEVNQMTDTATAPSGGDDPHAFYVPPPGPRRRQRPPYLTWAIAVAIVIVAPLASLLVTGQQATTYAAEAEVLANAGRDATTPVQLDTAVATESVILESLAVMAPAAERLGTSPETLDDSVDVEVVSESLILRVRAEQSDPETALSYLDAVVDSYSEVSSGADIPARQELIEERIAELVEARNGVEERLAAIAAANAVADAAALGPNLAEERRLEQESNNLLDRIGALEDQVLALELELAQSNQPVVVSPPHNLTDPLGPSRTQAIALGLFVGLGVATLLLIARYQLRAMRTSSPDEVVQASR